MKNIVYVYFLAFLTAIRRAGWLPFSIFLLHELCAHVIDGYTLWPPVDIPLHFFGGFAIAYFASGTIIAFAVHEIIERPHALIHMASVFSISCTAAVFWEFAEWTADHTLNTSCQIGLDDTMLDLLMGVLGAGVFVIAWLIKVIKKEMFNKKMENIC